MPYHFLTEEPTVTSLLSR